MNRTAGTVTFTTAPGVSPVAGQDNVKITASHTVEGYADRVNKCRIGIQFGVNGATDRLFLSGSPQLINYDWYSGLNDPTYWGDQAYSVLGQSDSAIVGYSIVNARLAAHKDSTDSDRNVIVREGNPCGQQARVPHREHFAGRGSHRAVFVWISGHGAAVFDKAGRLRHHGAGHYRGKIQPEPQLLSEREAAGGKRAGGSVRAGLQRHVLAVPEWARVHSGRAAGHADGPLGPLFHAPVCGLLLHQYPGPRVVGAGWRAVVRHGGRQALCICKRTVRPAELQRQRRGDLRVLAYAGS